MDNLVKGKSVSYFGAYNFCQKITLLFSVTSTLSKSRSDTNQFYALYTIHHIERLQKPCNIDWGISLQKGCIYHFIMFMLTSKKFNNFFPSHQLFINFMQQILLQCAAPSFPSPLLL